MARFKIRKKYLISAIVFGLATFFNWKAIPIQDNYVKIIRIVLATMFGGFTVKTAKDILVQKFGGNHE